MPPFRQLRRRVGFFRRGLRARRDLSGLERLNSPIFHAVVDAAGGKSGEAEKAWIDRIEGLRRRMMVSSEEVELMDYGAGTGDAKLGEEDMYQGRVIRRTIGQVCTTNSRTDRTALLLFRLVRELNPRVCIELGTAVGISGAYEAAAMKLNGAGKLITLEGADSLASIAAGNFAGLGLDNVDVIRGRFQDTLSKVLSANRAVDFAFIDGHHDEAATLRYFNDFLPVLAGPAVAVFDDIQWSEGMKRAWNEIRGRKEVRLSLDLGSMGIISTVGDGSPQHFTTAF